MTDLCEGKELFDRVSEKGQIGEAEASRIMKQILSAVSYCHSHKIVHRDLKPENVLFESNKENANIKVIDFGASNVFRQDEKMKQMIGTVMIILYHN